MNYPCEIDWQELFTFINAHRDGISIPVSKAR